MQRSEFFAKIDGDPGILERVRDVLAHFRHLNMAVMLRNDVVPFWHDPDGSIDYLGGLKTEPLATFRGEARSLQEMVFDLSHGV